MRTIVALLPRSKSTRWARAIPAALVASTAALVLPLTETAAAPGSGAGLADSHSLSLASTSPAPSHYGSSWATPHRPSSCSVPRTDPNTGSGTSTPTGTFPWPPVPAGTNPEVAAATDHTPRQFPPLRPANWSTQGNNWKQTSARTSDLRVAMNPQELCGVMGNSVDTAWQTTTGRPTTVIAVVDSGIEWCSAGIVDKIYLNRDALPLPENAQGRTKPELEHSGVTFSDADPYDLNDSGVFNVAQY